MGVVNSRNKLTAVKEQKGTEKERVPAVSLTVGNQVNIVDDNHHHHHHHQFNTHECNMNNKIHDRAHTIIQKRYKKDG